MTPETTAAMARCGIDHIGFDQLLPGDGRLEALVWSWAPSQPSSGDCVTQGADGRWKSTSCRTRARIACRMKNGTFSTAGSVFGCVRSGGRFAAPRTGYENAQLRANAGSEPVLLGLRRTRSGGFVATDRR
jgi:hypothetical protein